MQEIVRNTPDLLPLPEEEARVVWTLTHDENYSSKSAWEALNLLVRRFLGTVWCGLDTISPDGPLYSGWPSMGGLLLGIG